jgi:hypothetical protein
MIHVFCEWVCGLTNTLKRVDGGNEDVKECWFKRGGVRIKIQGKEEICLLAQMTFLKIFNHKSIRDAVTRDTILQTSQ